MKDFFTTTTAPTLSFHRQKKYLQPLPMSSHISDLQKLGVLVDEDIEAYVTNIVSTTASCSTHASSSSSWMHYIREGRFMNESILLGGISEIDFPFGTIISHPNTNERILGIANNPKVDLKLRAADVSKRFSRLTSRGSQSTILVPMAHDLHWGMVIVEDQKIFWGDSLGSAPFGTASRTVLDVMKAICECLFPSEKWVIQLKKNVDYCNYMLDVLQFEKQRDAYSCGFYILSVICGFSDSVGGLPAFPYSKYDKDVTELYRAAAVRGYFKRVKEVYSAKKKIANEEPDRTRKVRVSEIDVMMVISQGRMRFFKDPGPSSGLTREKEAIDAIERLTKVTAEDGINSFGIRTNHPATYVQELQKNMEYFSARKEVAVKNKEFSIRKLYSCFKFRSNCKATLTARYYPKEKIWRMTKSNVHNHGPVAPKPVVKRQMK